MELVNANLNICIRDTKHNTACLSVSVGRPVGSTQKQTTASHAFPHSLSLRPLSLYSSSEQSYRTGRL